jgi:thiol-disulfide isomerase/thioredoxin
MNMKNHFPKFLGLCLLAAGTLQADEFLPLLKANGNVYSNITVTKVTATDVFFIYTNGMGNAKLKNLTPELQKHFNYDAAKSAEGEKKLAENKTLYRQQLLSAQPVKPADYSREPEVNVAEGLEPGQKFPGFSVSDVSGNPLSVTGYQGKVVLIDFWATWCGPCRAELPNVIGLYQKYHGQGFEVIGISLDDDRNALNSFTQQQAGMGWQQYFDGQGWNNKLSRKYGVNSIPMTYLLNRQGIIIGKNLRGANLAAAVADALTGK